ncbi:hypothetical protein FRC17_010399 [Serendipita sp. 399]|nr:hypothetical protein FRC17_010399 [Serendipita sp. 399]
MALPTLPQITRLSENVIRILGGNPGFHTLQVSAGTNTYLVGKVPGPYILVDTGDGKPEYQQQLRDALLSSTSQGRIPLVSDVVITHKHRDHHGGLLPTLHTLKSIWDSAHSEDKGNTYPRPRIHKYPLPKHQALDAHSDGLQIDIPPELFDPPITPSDHPMEGNFTSLSDQQVLQGHDVALRVIHAPGHTDDSICLYLAEDAALFTADTVLGHGTAVFEDLSKYVETLSRLVGYDYGEKGLRRIYPGHGSILERDKAANTLQEYIDHRAEREAQVISVLNSREQSWTLEDVTASIYPQHVREFAKHGTYLHLKKLLSDARVEEVVEEDVVKWRLLK